MPGRRTHVGSDGGARTSLRCGERLRTVRDGRGFRAYLGLLALVAASRLIELRHSRRNERRVGPALGVAAPGGFPAMVGLHVALLLAPPAEIVACRRRFVPLCAVPALLTLAGATVLRVWSIRSLGDQWNVRGVVPVVGRVVDSGPYRFLRHPNYLAVSLEMAALPLVWPAPVSAVGLSLFNLAVLAPRIRAEERLLAQLPGYAEAMGAKQRLIPWLF
jgi:methyltransferase